ncbi:MAG: NADH-quinone oxidoreductase subunit M [Chloroflexota bacterium]|nr:NADH-quinone oxidoreductase subunit M [Dehalococcoidia bacterium]MDW8254868.1 NADH-quinone oxidoreductase subunit M [Chloroflexota bacterium]
MAIPLLSLMTLTPLAGALVLFAVPRERHGLIRAVALVAAGISAAAAAAVFLGYDSSRAGFQFVERLPWLPQLGIDYALAVDGSSAVMVLLTGVVIVTGVLVSWRIDYRPKDFFALLLILVAGVYGVFCSTDLFFFFFWYEVAVLPMYLLIAVWGSTNKEYGALKLTLMLVAGSILIWVGLLIVYAASGINSFDLFRLQQVAFDPTTQSIAFLLFMIGFGVLAGMWPLHTWSPDGHVAAPTAVSMLHAGVLMKLGAFGILRIAMTLLPEGARVWLPALLVLATVNVIYGALSAMAQRDLKYVVGYSSVSHMGYVLMGLASLSLVGTTGAVLQMFSHGIMTALFFAMVGVIYDQAHTRDIRAFGGLIRTMPAVSILFILAGLASLGLPGLSGFVAEVLVFSGLAQAQGWLFVALAVVGVAITATYILRLIARVFFGPPRGTSPALQEGSRLDVAAGAALAFFLIAVGLYPAPLLTPIVSSVLPIVRRLGGVE